MRTTHRLAIGAIALLCGMTNVSTAADDQATLHRHHESPPTLIDDVRRATKDFLDVNAAIAAGYGPAGGCVSGPENGAMGLHFANPALVGDGLLDADQPDILMYELRNGRMRLLGVEFLVIAEAWHKTHPETPSLKGQQFHYVGSPNRYGLPPFYELHVWAWRENPSGTFVDWNPRVSCDEVSGEGDSIE